MFSAQFIVSVITIFVVINLLMGAVSYGIMLERKIASWIQDRIGPNRVGPFGLFQPIADGIKFMIKEDYTPPGADKGLFYLAPALAVIAALIGWAVIPWGGYMTWGDEQILVAGATAHIGVIYILAVSSLAVYGVVLAGYASNNKYSFLGGLRATAQMLSYEIPLGLAVLIVILMHGTARADLLVELQANSVWNVFYQPIMAYIFFVCILAECNRAPFDLAECEQELVGGFHTEYSSMRFALFFLAEYLHMITASAFMVLLFFGGWDLPFWRQPIVGEEAGIAAVLLKIAVFIFKIFLIISLMMVIRWSLPRFRFDQLMKHAWRTLIPISVVMLLVTGLLVFLNLSFWMMTLANILVGLLFYVIAPKIPQGPSVNRRVPLAGSRFSPAGA